MYKTEKIKKFSDAFNKHKNDLSTTAAGIPENRWIYTLPQLAESRTCGYLTKGSAEHPDLSGLLVRYPHFFIRQNDGSSFTADLLRSLFFSIINVRKTGGKNKL